MALTRSANGLFMVPATGDRYWDVPLTAALATLDSLAALGQFNCGPTNINAAGQSISLSVSVAPGSYVKNDNVTVVAFAGGSVTLPANATTLVWLSQATNLLAVGTAWPTTACVRLASVVTGPSSVSSVVDARLFLRAYGT